MEKLKISPNRRYFVKEDGTPFSFLADTAWTIPQRLKWDDAELLMKKRREQGFTVLQIVALDPEQDVWMRSPAGDKALIGNDLSSPNERYFAYLDWILDKAEEYGFYVLLLPVWGQLVVGDNWLGETFEKTVTEDNAYGYGQWIGNRYKDRNHIIWCLGGDRQPIHKGTDYRDVWRRLAEGLAKGALGKALKYNQDHAEWEKLLITYHACHERETGKCSTMSYWTDEEQWISFIMLQSGHGSGPKNYELVSYEYDRKNVMPVWDGEPAYEMMPTSFPDFDTFHGPYMVRKRAYWSLLSGAFGHTYGHCSVWPSISEKERNPMFRLTWYEALSGEGAEQMRHLRAFMDDIRPMELIPCNEILSYGEDTLETHQQAAASEDGTTVCVYLPAGGRTQLKLAECVRKASEVNVWWYQPKDGRFYDMDGKETADAVKQRLTDGKLFVEAPGDGEENDWILIVKTDDTGIPVRSRSYGEEIEEETVKKVFEWN